MLTERTFMHGRLHPKESGLRWNIHTIEFSACVLLLQRNLTNVRTLRVEPYRVCLMQQLLDSCCLDT